MSEAAPAAVPVPVPVLIAYDCSGSTVNMQNYHAVTQQILSEFSGDAGAGSAAVRIVRWDDRWYEISRDELDRINRGKLGYNGTQISAVADAIVSLDFKGRLVLITDGEVDAGSVERCDQKLAAYGIAGRFTSVDVHIISRSPNLSVSCPFTRHCTHRIQVYNTTTQTPEYTNVIRQEDIALLANMDSIQTIAAFEEAHDGLLGALTARMMGSGVVDTQIHDQLVRLRGRLLAELSRYNTLGVSDKVHALGEATDFTEALGAYREIVDTFYATQTNTLDKRLANMLNITKGGLRTDFSHRLRRAPEEADADIANLAPTDAADAASESAPAAFNCPILMEDESDVAILIKERAPILDGLSAGLVEDLINCPLNALNCPEVVAAISACFDTAVGLPAIQMAEELSALSLLEESPFTREATVGALYLGANASQAAATDATLARMLTGPSRRRVGNMDLWAAVIWRILTDRKTNEAVRLDEASVTPAAERHLRWRLANRTTYASMSGQPGYLNIRVPLGLACWMVTTSPFLELPTKRDMVRAHVFHLRPIYDLAQMSGMPMPPSATLERQRLRLVALYRFLGWAKRADADFQACVRALYQKCAILEPEKHAQIINPSDYCKYAVRFVPLDGPASPDQTQAVLSKCFADLAILGAEEIVYIASLVSPNAAADTIALPAPSAAAAGTAVAAAPAAAVTWPEYGLSTTTLDADIPICPATMRPYYYIPPECDKTWKDAALATYGTTPATCISANTCYIRFVERFGRFPANADELIVFIYYFYVVYRDVVSLPAPIVQFANEVYDSYAQVISGITPEEFNRRAMRSMPIQLRIEIEKAAVIAI
jgi:hypothetical protein